MRITLRLLFGLAALSAVIASFFVDVHAGLGVMLRPPRPDVYRYWLPVLIFLVLVLCWLARRLWSLVEARPATFEFQDMDAAWHEAMQFLEEFEIDIRATPVFVVLGQNGSRFFSAPHLQMTPIPLSRTADFSVYMQSSGEALFVTCPGASSITLESFTQRSSSAQRAKELAAMQKILAKAQKEGRGLDQLTEEEKDSISTAIEEEQHGEVGDDSYKTRRRLRKATARLRHLCHLISQERQPYCPVNGILVLLPFAAATSTQRAEHAASCIQQDLQTARRAFQVDCPVTVAVCDLQEASGAAQVLEQTSEGSKHQAFGLRFPLLPDLDPHETAAMLESGVTWVCQTLTAKTVCRLMRPGAEPSARNVAMYRFSRQLRDCASRFASIVSRGTELPDGAAVMVSGFYFAAAGEGAHEHAFVTGLLRELHQHQNYVSWTPETLGRNARSLRIAGVGFVAMIGVLVSVGYFCWPM